MESGLLTVHRSSPAPDRDRLVARARALAWFGIAWHVGEAAIAVIAGLAAGSVALIGFGTDSLIETAAGLIVVWRFAAARLDSESAELHAQRLIAASFVLLAVYVGIEATRSLINADHPDASWVGMGLAAVTLIAMPLLARAKSQVGNELHSSATVSESRQTMICAYLSAGLLLGLGANAILGWWWADPMTALGIAGVAVYEARESWRGNACCATC
jgi:divalent metal cation (Fe/Co/Zn/Cd) transporter